MTGNPGCHLVYQVSSCRHCEPIVRSNHAFSHRWRLLRARTGLAMTDGAALRATTGAGKARELDALQPPTAVIMTVIRPQPDSILQRGDRFLVAPPRASPRPSPREVPLPEQPGSGLPSPGSAQCVLSITNLICAQSRRRDGRDEVLRQHLIPPAPRPAVHTDRKILNPNPPLPQLPLQLLGRLRSGWFGIPFYWRLRCSCGCRR